MSNIDEKTKGNHVQLHIVKGYEVLDQHLPEQYVELTLAQLGSEYPHITSGIVRNVRNKKPAALKQKHMPVLNALLRVALEAKKQKEDLANLLKG